MPFASFNLMEFSRFVCVFVLCHFQNALLSALPYLAMWVISLAVSPISDYLINREVVGIATGRKLFNSFGHWVPALTLVILPFLRDPTQAIAMLTIAIGMNGCTYCGYMVNHMDLSPNFAGSLMGLTNSLANTMSILGPITVGLILTDDSDTEVSRNELIEKIFRNLFPKINNKKNDLNRIRLKFHDSSASCVYLCISRNVIYGCRFR